MNQDGKTGYPTELQYPQAMMYHKLSQLQKIRLVLTEAVENAEGDVNQNSSNQDHETSRSLIHSGTMPGLQATVKHPDLRPINLRPAKIRNFVQLTVLRRCGVGSVTVSRFSRSTGLSGLNLKYHYIWSSILEFNYWNSIIRVQSLKYNYWSTIIYWFVKSSSLAVTCYARS